MKILKRIGLFAVAILMAVGAVFLPKTLNSANADTTTSTGIEFNSSNLIVCRLGNSEVQNFGPDFSKLLVGTANTPSQTVDNVQLSWSFRLRKISANNIAFDIRGYYSPTIYLGSSSDEYFNSIDSISIKQAYRSYEYYDTPCFSAAYLNFNAYSSGFKYSAIGVSLSAPLEGSESNPVQPTLDMVSVEISNYKDFTANTGSPYSGTSVNGIVANFTNSNVVSYVDTAGYRYTFFIPCLYDMSSTTWSYTDSYYYSYRKYLLDDAFDFSDNSIYLQGVTDGKADGYNNGYNIGYREGSVVGYDNGYSIGYDDGVFESNDYSFFGLITAVIDAPVRILTSLFNFNFLGINLWLFITSLLTISLVIIVLRKFMGKG